MLFMVWDKKRKLEGITLEDFQDHPRTSSWIPRHSDILRVVENCRTLGNPKILDAACGSGFVSSLIAMEGIFVKGVNIAIEDEILYGVDNLTLIQGKVEDSKTYKGIKIIFNSWMAQSQDWSGYFKYAKPTPKMIMYVKGRSTGLQPDMPGNINKIDSYTLPFGFVEVDRWKTYGHDDFNKQGNLVMPSCEVIIQVQKEVYGGMIAKFDAVKKTSFNPEPYNWEKEMPSA